MEGIVELLAKKDAFSGVRDKFGNLGTRWFDPSSATKSSELGKIFWFSIGVSKLDGRFVFSSFREGI